MPEFKFKIGDVVCHRGDRNQLINMVIVARTAEECSGGVQLHYPCRVVSFDRGSSAIQHQIVMFSECELEPAPERTLPSEMDRIYKELERLSAELRRMKRAEEKPPQ
jgi:hypothetical protein